MSTDYRPLTQIRFKDLFDGRLAEFGVLEHHSEEATFKKKCLTDGRNFLWVHRDEKGLATFTRYMPNGSPEHILGAIQDGFDVDIVSEHQPQYWGFATKEAWDAAERKFRKELRQREQHFWNEIVRYAEGKIDKLEQDFFASSAAAEMARIAKTLVSEAPDLVSENKRPHLIKAVEQKYHQHLVDTGQIPF